MKSSIKNILLAFLFLLISATSVSAATLKHGERVVLPKETIIPGDYFASGESVIVSGTVGGDAYIGAGRVTVDGTVQGDLLVGAGTVAIEGTVEKDVRVAAGEVTISGVVNGNISVTGGSIRITNDAKIAGNVVVAGGEVRIDAPILKDVVAGAGDLTISSIISGDVLAGVGNLTLSPEAQIVGNLTYYSDDSATVSKDATISGMVNHQIVEKPTGKDTRQLKNAAQGVMSMVRILNIFIAFIFGVLFLNFFPNASLAVTNRIQKNPWASMGIGFLALIMLPILGFVLLITLIGMPFALLLFFAYFFYMFLAKVFVSMVIGKIVLGYFKTKYPPVAVLAIGLVIYLLLTSIPVLGGLIVFVSLLIGMGAILLGKKDYYKMLSTKKVI